MVNPKTIDFVFNQMMQEFKNGLLHHFLKDFNLVQMDFGIVHSHQIKMGHQRPVVVDNCLECMPVFYNQNQKLNLILANHAYFDQNINGLITHTHYLNRDVKINAGTSGSSEYLEMSFKYNFFDENENSFDRIIAFIMDHVYFYLLQFKNNHSQYKHFCLYEISPNYL